MQFLERHPAHRETGPVLQPAPAQQNETTRLGESEVVMHGLRQLLGDQEEGRGATPLDYQNNSPYRYKTVADMYGAGRRLDLGGPKIEAPVGGS